MVHNKDIPRLLHIMEQTRNFLVQYFANILERKTAEVKISYPVRNPAPQSYPELKLFVSQTAGLLEKVTRSAQKLRI